MTHEAFREFASRLAATLGFELDRELVESPLAITIDELRIILDQDLSTGSPELVLHALIGKIDEKRELETMRVLLEGNYLWSQTGGGILGVNSESREVVFACKVPLASVPDGATAAQVLSHFLMVAGLWTVYLSGGELEFPDQDEDPLPGFSSTPGGAVTFVKV